MSEGQRVCAVVVTYNRKELLAGCLDALLGQSYSLDRLLVVDNASTDGTEQLLHERGYLRDGRLEHLRLAENRGGAGGFHEGFKRALALQPDWIWAMDDDGLAAPDCLERLIEAAASDFRGPLVLARERMEDPANDELAFPAEVDHDGAPLRLRTRRDAEQVAREAVVTGFASVFNGVLIHRRAAQRIGLPDEKFFIWGDEWDYVFRARRAGIPLTTVLSALYWHPRDRADRAKIHFGGTEYEVPCADSAFRNYLLIRNHAYLAYRYRGIAAWLRHTLKYLLFHRSVRGSLSMGAVLRYSFEGLRGRFNGTASVD